jgi:nucleotide-binding universal stress UspA family protein
VVDWPFPDADMSDPTDPLCQLRRNLEAHAHEQLLRLAESSGVSVKDIVVPAGRPRRHILRLAQERGVDLIAMGSMGHGALERAFVGSTTRHVLRESECPVLVVPVGQS